MNAMRRASCFLICLACMFPLRSNSTAAEHDDRLYYADEIVVTASRIKWPIEKTASSLTVITKEEIRKYQTTSVVDILRSVMGMEAIQSGSAGKTSSVLIRGSNSNHCLLMIDGVPLNDPTTGGFDFSNLVTSDIERIEIVRGPHGILYGSNAIGGVINIVTDAGKDGARRSVSLSGGSFGTAAGSASASGSSGNSTYTLSLSRMITDGRFSNDFYKNTSLTGTISSRVTDNSDLTLGIKYYDVTSGVRGPSFDTDPDAVQTGGAFLVSSTYKHYIHGNWNFLLRTSFFTNEITFDDPLDALDTDPFAGDVFSEINSDVQNITWQNNIRLLDRVWAVSGLDWREERTTNSSSSPFGPANFDSKIRNTGLFLNLIFDFNSLFTASSGVRVDDHSEFGTVSTYKLSLSLPVHTTGTIIKGSIGSGFRAPSLNELFYPGYGNPDLKPEETVGYDIGVSQEIESLRVAFDVMYFMNDYKNMISWNPETFIAGNIGESLSRGVEFSSSFNTTGSFSLRGFYTYLHTEDVSTGDELYRRPRHSGGISLSMSRGPLDILLSSALVGRRLDNDFGGPMGEHYNASYSRHDASVTYHFGESYEAFLRLVNILDEKYDEVAGYPSPGINTMIGARVTF
jgi:vitamin B12 transporter